MGEVPSYGAPGITAAFVLQLLRLQAPQVHALHLAVADAFDDVMWRVLGQVSQLTRLELKCSSCDEPLELTTLASLSGLAQLQHLDVQQPEEFWGDDTNSSCAYLASLSRLTHLAAPLPSAGGLAALSGLKLRHLEARLVCSQTEWDELPCVNGAACAALASLALTLTQLDLQGFDSGAERSPGFLASLARLQRLRVLKLHEATDKTLAVVAGMPSISELRAVLRPAAADVAPAPQDRKSVV